MHLRIGTRKSHLAIAQSQSIAIQLEKLGHTTELIGIDTQGDQIVDRPLYALQGRDFFVKQIDEALLESKIDCAVHSFKDLSVIRPEDIACPAITQRENPRDVLILNRHARNKIQHQQKIKIGTSSPRRIALAKNFLPPALNVAADLIEYVDLRGNVPTRITRLHEPNHSSRYLDGIILALAGLIRLPDSLSLLKGLTPVLLPLTHFPGCPGQGALAIECLTKNKKIYHILEHFNHPMTREAVEHERSYLIKHGGGCHQAFGVTCIEHATLGRIVYFVGKTQSKFEQEIFWNIPQKKPFIKHIFDGMQLKPLLQTVNTPITLPQEDIFITHARALNTSDPTLFADKRLWVSGVSSWFKLAKKGFFIHGCAEGLGFNHLQDILNNKIFQFPTLFCLSHRPQELSHGAKTYTISFTVDKELQKKLAQADCIYWGSSSQFEALHLFCRPNVLHCCGAGKTLEYLQSLSIKALAFPCYQEWKKWTSSF